MIFSRAHVVCGLAFALAASAIPLRADLVTNPYASITDRNPFGLKDPPPPPAPQSDAPPPAPAAKVTLTGLISMFGEPRALFEIFDEPGKSGTPKKPILREGERMGGVEVLAINVEKNIVTIRNSGQETNLTFEIANAGKGGAPGGGGAPPPLSVPAPSPMSSAAAPGPGSPTIISANAGNGGGGVTLFGGNPVSAPPANTPSYAAANTAGGALGNPSGYGNANGYGNSMVSTDSGLRNIPTRPLRTEVDSGPPMSRDQVNLLIEAERLKPNVPPLPPTELTPLFENEKNSPQPQPGGDGFPTLPSQRGLRPPGRR